MAKIKPINQILHKRARKTWQKIADGTAGDPDKFTEITTLPFPNPHYRFPSSYLRTLKEEPPPIFTERDCLLADVIAYYREN